MSLAQLSEIASLLDRVLDKAVADPSSASFDFEQAFLSEGCDAATADLLADYLPEACGRAFLTELGVIVDETYRRRTKDGGWSEPQRFADDPLWVNVERYVETIRTSATTRKKFSLAGQRSAACDAISNGVDAGKTLESFRGGHYSSVFRAPRKTESEY